MQFLIRPKPFIDEALESFLLRVSLANGLQAYKRKLDVIYKKLNCFHGEEEKHFPLKINLINLFHGHEGDQNRIHILKALETNLGLSEKTLLKLALIHSDTLFCNRRVSVSRLGTDIPLCFIRKTGIPICIKCLRDNVYIRHTWHYSVYQSCHLHKCQLLMACPQCNHEINYMVSEAIAICQCGYDLRESKITDSGLCVDFRMSDDYDSSDCRFFELEWSKTCSLFLWYFERFNKGGETKLHALSSEKLEAAVKYLKYWPKNLTNELDRMVANAGYKLVKMPSQTPFSHVFGDLIPGSMVLSATKNTYEQISKHIKLFLFKLIDENPRSKISNLADLLISINDIAILFSVKNSAVYEAFSQGKIIVAFKMPSQYNIQPFEPLFHLRQILTLRFC